MISVANSNEENQQKPEAVLPNQSNAEATGARFDPMD